MYWILFKYVIFYPILFSLVIFCYLKLVEYLFNNTYEKKINVFKLLKKEKETKNANSIDT